MIEGSCHCGRVRWRINPRPASATPCNCTLCRRYGVLWAYGDEQTNIQTVGETQRYVWGTRHTGFHFCGACGCITHWRALRLKENGRYRAAVNLRLAEPEAVADIPLVVFDGLHSMDDLPADGRHVRDVWC